MEDIKSCPFCGGKAKVYVSNDGRTYVECTQCNPMKYMQNTRQEAIDAWNKRKEVSQ